MPPPTAYATALGLMAVPLAIWCTIASLQAVAIRHAFAPGQPLGTDLAALSRARFVPAILRSPLCAPPMLLIVPVVRLVAGLALPFVAGTALGVAVALILACTALLAIATGGSDGSEKIAMVTCTAALLVVAGQVSRDQWLCLAGLAWVAGQATIAYTTSGAAKLARGFWRDGTALVAAMTSYRSGHAWAATVVRHRPAALVIAWGIMLLEALFPFALFAPAPVCLAVLAALGLFHFATAIVMGLNTYPWAFMATYPFVLAANAALVGTASAAG